MLLRPAPSGALLSTRSLGGALLLALAGSLVIAVAARIQVPMWPVPMTMQSFAVMAVGIALGARLGTATVGLYLMQGAVGLPVFAGGAGLVYMAGPTGGYLVGFVLAAWALGRMADRGLLQSWRMLALGLALATFLIFVPGAIWLSTLVGPQAAIVSGVLPFLPGAVIKGALLAVLVMAVVKRRQTG